MLRAGGALSLARQFCLQVVQGGRAQAPERHGCAAATGLAC